MSLAVVLTLSCGLAAVTLAIYSAILFVGLQSGGRGLKALFDRFFGGGSAKEKTPPQRVTAQQSPEVKSGDVLRQRAKNLEFNPGASFQAQSQSQGGFAAQSAAPIQPSLTSRDPLRPSPPASQLRPSAPNMPRLSTSRPFGGGPITPSQGFQQQPPAPPGQFGQGQNQGGSFGTYNPGLRGRPGSNMGEDGNSLRRRRDSRRHDDHDIHDDGNYDDGIMGDFGDFHGG